MKKLTAWLRMIDQNLIKIFVVAYIFIMPLYPKIPLKTVDFTYIAIRLEDLFMALFTLVFAIQLLRKKVVLPKNYLILFALFWIAVFASYLFGFYISHTIPPDLKQVGLLHSLRRIQYMLPFFFGIAVIRSEKDFLWFLKLILIVLFIVCVYGIGQKFLGWPAIQTMNPEYSRGHLLVLTPEARISSTFAGHYDLAAYLILLLPLVYGFYFFRKKVTYLVLFVVSLFAMILTASRVSFGAYLVSLTSYLLFLRKFKHLALVLVLTVAFTMMNSNLTSRIKRTFQIKRIFVNEKTGQFVVPQKSTIKELPAGSFYIPIQGKAAGKTEIITDQKLMKEKILSDLRWEASRSGKTLTASEEATMLEKITAGLKPINTVVSDISLATRLQVEWPRALAAFLTNPLLGGGPSSITEATDNDYLRWLGEFGLFATVIFIYILFSIAKDIFTNRKNKKKIIYYGFLFGFFGLMINAGWIDVFEASKVAYTFWLVSGLFVGSTQV